MLLMWAMTSIRATVVLTKGEYNTTEYNTTSCADHFLLKALKEFEASG